MLANDAPLPVLTPETTPFWTGGEDGALMIARCSACTRYVHPPQPICPHCLSREIAPVRVSGRGTVASFTVNHQRWLPDMRVPFVIALIELEEQPDIRITTNLVNQPIEAAAIGQRVRVLFERHEDIWLPLFEPDGETGE
ncbi:Zn-ribbon domain-containing OB-fold protein [Flavisphingomonas formosensis]|uniref:Zn-ribbon domain-containing OB-fold protein n=1 Tax=Flavisphingomonas formosensis TaxID=861534 RepID=UPI0018E03759|nr:OB-fold domain-containing protein [Sphingomonas formosensis]